MRGVGCSLITLPVSIKLYRSMSGSLEGDVPEKIHTPTTDWILEILTGGGVKDSGNSGGRRVEHEKVFCTSNFDQ